MAGVLRGCGRQRTVMTTNAIGFWAIGVPLGAGLANGIGPLGVAPMGVRGVWWGLTGGLSVAALGGRPGVYTADWAEKAAFEGGPGRDWYMAMGKVEGRLAEQGPDVDRSARFFSTLAVMWPDGHHELFEGSVSGTLVWPPRGGKGFGYDPVFMIDGETRTFGEMDPAEKQEIDHRAVAFAKLVAAVF